MFSKPATNPLRNIFANYHFCGLLGATGGCSPCSFFVNLDHDGEKSKTSELHTKLTEGTKVQASRHSERLKQMMAILHRVSWWLEHAQANSERIILTTLHYTIVVRKVSVAMYHVYPWISRFLILNHLKPWQTKTTIYMFAGSIINCHWFKTI